jgi:GntR family transcriptional regulator
VRVRRATGVAAEQLQLAADALVVSRHQDGYVDGAPYSRQTTFYPHSFVTQGATRLVDDENVDRGVVSYLGEVLGVREDGWLDIFGVRVPSAAEAVFFELPDDGRVPVLEWIRTGYDQRKRPVRVTITTCAAGRNVFAIPTGNVPEKYPALGWLRTSTATES